MFDAGIASLGLAFPSLGIDVRELARVRDIDPNKFTLGLGCGTIALCDQDENAVTLGAKAARRALERWDGTLEDIGMIVVGTETAADMSRPLSAFIAEELGLEGAVRSYEVKHACYGGTLALRQALEWKASGAAGDKAALVIASDVALYGECDGGEPTSGAGAVAFIVDKPTVAAVEIDSYAWSKPAFDFWRPVGEDYPRVDGKFSLDCYNEAVEHCFAQRIGDASAASVLSQYDAICFHVPFPKMVKKGVTRLGEHFQLGEDVTGKLFAEKVDPTMAWNREVGNCYTAALWIAVARALADQGPGAHVAAFSYGSGFGAELLGLVAGDAAADAAWVADVEQDLAARRLLTGEEYLDYRAARRKEVREVPLRQTA
ncbi:MAG: hydroxymethylglutaryl-CoA synthase family protein [Candidatus Dadabacteria bacterium]|nr:MAG: hydroxymethylglutaryl-CoA synthase family protein [Candidatus Dadabacteria bacterium]